MSRPRTARMTRVLEQARCRVRRGGSDDGFLLVEVMIALSLIAVIMAAVGVEFVSGVANTSHQRAIANATEVAADATSSVRALDPSDVLIGRSLSAVTTERDTLRNIPKIAPWINSDPTVLAYNNASAAAAAVPTTGVTSSPAGSSASTSSYTVYTYLECVSAAPMITNPDGTTSQRNCSPASRTNAVADYLRLVVAVVWTQRGCPSTGCAFVTASLLDGHANPTFDLNQPLPAAPVINDPGDQTVAVGDAVSLQLTVKDGTGVAPFSWTITSGSLPQGLTMSGSGLITGTVAGSAQPAAKVTIQMSDAFNRFSSVTDSWTVLDRLVLTPPGDQNSTTSSTVNLSLSASGGAGAPYTYSDPKTTLPPGLTLSTAGVITGKPTITGTYSVNLTVADKSTTRTATASFTWTVTVPPLSMNNPGSKTFDNGVAISTVALSPSGGTGSYVVTATGLPDGLSINATTGDITGTPTKNGTFNVTATVTDSANSTLSVSFTWQVVNTPTITTPGTQATTKGGTASVQVNANCPNSPCTYALSNAPNNLAINASTGLITGTIASNATTSTTVTVKVTDSQGKSATTSSFTWTVNAAPAVASPGDQQTKSATAVTLDMSTRTSGGTTPYTYSATNLPSWLTINKTSGVISGTSPTVSKSTTAYKNITVTATDASGVVATAAPFAWYVSDLVVNVPDYSIANGSSISVNLTDYTTGGTGPYTFTTSGLPPGLTQSGTTVSGKLTTKGTYTVTIVATDSVGASYSDTSKITVT